MVTVTVVISPQIMPSIFTSTNNTNCNTLYPADSTTIITSTNCVLCDTVSEANPFFFLQKENAPFFRTSFNRTQGLPNFGLGFYFGCVPNGSLWRRCGDPPCDRGPNCVPRPSATLVSGSVSLYTPGSHPKMWKLCHWLLALLKARKTRQEKLCTGKSNKATYVLLNMK